MKWLLSIIVSSLGAFFSALLLLKYFVTYSFELNFYIFLCNTSLPFLPLSFSFCSRSATTSTLCFLQLPTFYWQSQNIFPSSFHHIYKFLNFSPQVLTFIWIKVWWKISSFFLWSSLTQLSLRLVTVIFLLGCSA